METPDTIETRMKRVLARMCESGLSVTTAESCTGGLVAAQMTDIEGCSHAFDRGFVTSTDAAKQELLGVDAALLAQKGAVSAEVAIQMAEQAIRRSRADLAVSVTGYAGSPGGEAQEGLVHFALARRDGPTVHRKEEFGAIGRDAIRDRCLHTVVALLEDAVS